MCHVSVYSDADGPLRSFFREGLELPVVVPPTPYAYGDASPDEDEDDEEEEQNTVDKTAGSSQSSELRFDLEMFLLGSGTGVEVYRDPALHRARAETSQPPGSIGNVALEAPSDSTDTAHALVDRHLMELQPKPVVYHVPEDPGARRAWQRLQDSLPSPTMAERAPPQYYEAGEEADGGGSSGLPGRVRPLPAWLFRKQWVRIGGDKYSLNDEAVQTAARLGGAMPPCGYHFVCQWHPAFAYRPSRWRLEALDGLPVGALGITGCNRITWVVDDPDGEALDPTRNGVLAGTEGEEEAIGGSAPSIAALALQWSKLNHASWQRSARELEVRMPAGGPNLHYVAAGGPSGRLKERVGRMLGWECAVYSLEHAWAVLRSKGLDGLAVPEASSRGRLVLALDAVGGTGLEMHLVPQSPAQRRATLASEGALRQLEAEGREVAVGMALATADGRGRRAHRVSAPLPEGLQRSIDAAARAALERLGAGSGGASDGAVGVGGRPEGAVRARLAAGSGGGRA